MILGIKTKNANRNNKHKLTNNNICIFSSAKFEDIFWLLKEKFLWDIRNLVKKETSEGELLKVPGVR